MLLFNYSVPTILVVECFTLNVAKCIRNRKFENCVWQKVVTSSYLSLKC